MLRFRVKFRACVDTHSRTSLARSVSCRYDELAVTLSRHIHPPSRCQKEQVSHATNVLLKNAIFRLLARQIGFQRFGTLENTSLKAGRSMLENLERPESPLSLQL